MGRDYKLRLPSGPDCAIIRLPHVRDDPAQGKELISLAQQLARDAERHAILSASLASQADRLMVAGLRLLEPPHPIQARNTRPRP